jgi:tetratricopeptide (TPR) repeat protein
MVAAALRGDTLDDSTFQVIDLLVDELSRKRRAAGPSPLYRARIVECAIKHARYYALRQPPRGILLARFATLIAPRIPSRGRKRGPRSLLLEANTYRVLAYALMQDYRCSEALDAVLRARELLSGPGVADQAGKEPALLDLVEGHALVYEGEHERGLAMIAAAGDQLLAVFHERRLFSVARGTYGGMLMWLRRHEEALAVFEQSLVFAIEAGDQETVAAIVHNIGFCSQGVGDPRAERCHQLAVEMFRRHGMTSALINAREFRAAELAAAGRLEESIAEYDALRQDLYALGMDTFAETMASLIIPHLLTLGRIEEAITLGTAAIQKLEAAGCATEVQRIRELLEKLRK